MDSHAFRTQAQPVVDVQGACEVIKVQFSGFSHREDVMLKVQPWRRQTALSPAVGAALGDRSEQRRAKQRVPLPSVQGAALPPLQCSVSKSPQYTSRERDNEVETVRARGRAMPVTLHSDRKLHRMGAVLRTGQ